MSNLWIWKRYVGILQTGVEAVAVIDRGFSIGRPRRPIRRQPGNQRTRCLPFTEILMVTVYGICVWWFRRTHLCNRWEIIVFGNARRTRYRNSDWWFGRFFGGVRSDFNYYAIFPSLVSEIRCRIGRYLLNFIINLHNVHRSTEIIRPQITDCHDYVICYILSFCYPVYLIFVNIHFYCRLTSI